MSYTNLQFAITYIKWHLIFGVDHFFSNEYIFKNVLNKFNLDNCRPAYEEINNRERSTQEYEALSHTNPS